MAFEISTLDIWLVEEYYVIIILNQQPPIICVQLVSLLYDHEILYAHNRIVIADCVQR